MTLQDHLLDLAALPTGAIPSGALDMARLSLFDWLVCGIAGRNEPVARILRQMVLAEGGTPVASLFGGGAVPARAAALANGAASHALDYDDTHFAHVGHPSVAIYPAALALAQAGDLPADRLVDAFAIGAELSIRLGLALGAEHYARGFHQTATAGAFGATAAAGRVLGLDRDAMRRALGLCATRASGVRVQFGTMGKPYNAGIAASNGVECALLAAGGMSAPDDALGAPQGFFATHSIGCDLQAAFGRAPADDFLLTQLQHKLHACCHGTHAMIEGLRRLAADPSVTADLVERIEVETAPRWLSVCAIPRPRTGLEVKFSYAFLAAMVLSGRDTARDSSYTDALAADPVLGALAARMQVTADPALDDMQTRGRLYLRDGRVLPFAHDLAARPEPEALARALREKARALIGAGADRIWDAVAHPGATSARDLEDLLQQDDFRGGEG